MYLKKLLSLILILSILLLPIQTRATDATDQVLHEIALAIESQKYNLAIKKADKLIKLIKDLQKSNYHPPEENQNDASEQKQVEFIDYRMEIYPTDYTRNSKPYRAHIRAYFQFRNNTGKKLTGLIFNIKFKDSFNDIIYKKHNVKTQLSLAPGKTNNMQHYWYWKDNPFIEDEPYDKLAPAVSSGSIKVKLELLKASFQDGTILNLK